MKTIKQFIIPVSVLLLSQLALADGESKLTFEPIYGMETRLVQFPAPPRYVTDAVYGARVLYGSTLLSGEGEYTTTKSRKDYPDLNQKVEDSAERMSLGLRTTLPMSQYFGAFFRAGGRAGRGETVITTNGVDDRKTNALRIDPYAGAGIQLAFHSNFALNAGATLIRNSEDKYDTQYTLGLSARFGNR